MSKRYPHGYEDQATAAALATALDAGKVPMSLATALQVAGLPKHLRTSVTYNGQAYVDEPKFRYVHPTPIANAVRFAHTGKQIRPIQIFVGIERVRINWERP